MNQLTLATLALTGGVLLALQTGLNARLGVLLKNPLLASLTGYSCSTLVTFLLVVVAVRGKGTPSQQSLREIPAYLWFSGGLCSAMGISLYYYTIPRLGVSTMLSLGLSGQLLFSVIAGHFGWFHLPEEPVSATRLIGVAAMLLGIMLINYK
jgi:transporter family-2 protein